MSVSICTELPAASKPVKEVGVDWMTVTCGDTERGELLQDSSFMWLQAEESAGNKIRPWSMSGFNGFHCGGVSFGELNGTWLLRLSGPTAQAHWRRAYHLSTNISRLDLQVTISDVEDGGALIRNHFAEATAHFATWRKPPAIDVWKSNNGSATLYVNRRVSEQFGRIYDKAIESKLEHYRACLRYEVEFKGDVAPLVAQWVSEQENEAAAILNRVQRFFLERGILPAFLGATVHTLSVSRSRPDVDRQLQWLKASVSRSVKDLIALGKLPEVLDNLGITNEVLRNLWSMQNKTLNEEACK